jgi:hypothetical protein
MMRRFTMYRRGTMPDTHNPGTWNLSNEPQFEGVVATDGSVAIRWMTAYKSWSLWSSFEEMLAVHGHPEYVSDMVWHDS